MHNSNIDDQLIKQSLSKAKTIAMIGVSSAKKEDEISSNIKRKPSIIVMKYLQEFGYKVIPVNPFAIGKKICGEFVVAKLEDITIPIDVVNVFRPSKEVPVIAKQAANIKAKVLWLQFGIENHEARGIAEKASIVYIANRCIKQEYQRLFSKVNPVFPALLQTD
tara:strand:- start:83 stop:574 length:492 start_codon:yes stop_codon:yes gene_type:complete